jgi:hypothetical protein
MTEKIADTLRNPTIERNPPYCPFLLLPIRCNDKKPGTIGRDGYRKREWKWSSNLAALTSRDGHRSYEASAVFAFGEVEEPSVCDQSPNWHSVVGELDLIREMERW